MHVKTLYSCKTHPDELLENEISIRVMQAENRKPKSGMLRSE